MNYQKIDKYNVANGPGIRTVLWVSGCSHHCPGCHNSGTWDENSGVPFTQDSLSELLESLEPHYVAGLTLSGGDPLYPKNREAVTEIARIVKEKFPNKDIWLWTGFLYEEVKDLEIMRYIDVLVDGRFILEQRNLMLEYRGSGNQRVINIKKMREEGGGIEENLLC